MEKLLTMKDLLAEIHVSRTSLERLMFEAACDTISARVAAMKSGLDCDPRDFVEWDRAIDAVLDLIREIRK